MIYKELERPIGKHLDLLPVVDTAAFRNILPAPVIRSRIKNCEDT
jgi:hypothetical protein